MAVVSGTDAVSLTKKKARPKTITKKGPVIFVRCGKVHVGKPTEWIQINSIGAKLSESPSIGIWGMVKKGNKPLREIAEAVYGTPILAEFIAKANKIVGKFAFDGQRLYIPNLTKRNFTENGHKSSSYIFNGVNLIKEISGPIISGDIYVDFENITEDQYWYDGVDNTSRCTWGGAISFITAQLERLGCPEVGENTVTNLYSKYDTTQQIWLAVHYNKYVRSKLGTKGTVIWKIGKEAKGFKKTKSWVGKDEFLKRYLKGSYKAFFSKENIGLTIFIAGDEAIHDFDINRHAGHATFVGGKSIYKTVTASATGLLVGCVTALFLPEIACAWVIVAGASIVSTVVAGNIMDHIDSWQQNAGVEAYWFKTLESKTSSIIAK